MTKLYAIPGERQAEQIEALLRSCSAGDRDATERLAALCLPRVRRTVALSYGGGADAEDLVQNAMTRVFSKLDSFRGEASFLIWVDRIAINVIKDHFKKRRFIFFSENAEKEGEAMEATPRFGPDRDAERYRLFDRLAGHFATIHPKRRLPLVLSLFQGYTVPEIAALLDLSFDAAKMRLRSGRRDLMKRLKTDPYCRQAILELGR
jgi:RNA polymerase sigma-70 factor (ECF subfamily)